MITLNKTIHNVHNIETVKSQKNKTQENYEFKLLKEISFQILK